MTIFFTIQVVVKLQKPVDLSTNVDKTIHLTPFVCLFTGFSVINIDNAVINVWLAQPGRTADSMNPVERLCYIGARGMGALECRHFWRWCACKSNHCLEPFL